MGAQFTAADIQMSFIPELARAVGAAGDHPAIEAWQNRLYARRGFDRAIARGGPYSFAQPI